MWHGGPSNTNMSLYSTRVPVWYPIRRLIVRLGKDSKARDRMLKCSYRFEIWQACRQHCRGDACQIAERSGNSKYKSRGIDTLRDLIIRRLIDPYTETRPWLLRRMRLMRLSNIVESYVCTLMWHRWPFDIDWCMLLTCVLRQMRHMNMNANDKEQNMMTHYLFIPSFNVDSANCKSFNPKYIKFNGC